jgi:hypothetical protein
MALSVAPVVPATTVLTAWPNEDLVSVLGTFKWRDNLCGYGQLPACLYKKRPVVIRHWPLNLLILVG